MVRASGLGRGLGALIPNAGPNSSGLLSLELSTLVPNARQPRGTFEDAALEELAQSLRQVGMLQPILVRPRPDGRYEIVAGERRFRAAQRAGFDRVPALVRHTADEHMLAEALVENIHRTDLSPLEEAAAYDQLLSDFGMTHEALAVRLGRSRSAITNALRLLGLPATVQHRLADGSLSAGHARALIPLEDGDRQEQLAQRIVADSLSVRAVEEMVRLALLEAESSEASRQELAGVGARRSSPFSGLERRLEEALATRVQIKGTARRGRMVIDYAGREDLERLLDILGRGAGTDLLHE